ncbi:MAG TPA: RbsD/FucU domain-containing protein [Terracidiphilus sp.]|nr:RbsD/FucU domain-containing protein [Terracidiphilus sp.]
MVRTGILNPQLNSLLSRVRHTNTLLIADRGFPYWPTIETVDLALIDNIPRVLDVLGAIRMNFSIGRITMAQEFRQHNSPGVVSEFAEAMSGIEVDFEPHNDLKKRVPLVIGLVRTADTIQYANMILESS